MTPDHNLLECVHLRRKRLKAELSDADWEGDHEKAERLERELTHTEHLIEAGVLWYTAF